MRLSLATGAATIRLFSLEPATFARQSTLSSLPASRLPVILAGVRPACVQSVAGVAAGRSTAVAARAGYGVRFSSNELIEIRAAFSSEESSFLLPLNRLQDAASAQRGSARRRLRITGFHCWPGLAGGCAGAGVVGAEAVAGLGGRASKARLTRCLRASGASISSD